MQGPKDTTVEHYMEQTYKGRDIHTAILRKAADTVNPQAKREAAGYQPMPTPYHLWPQELQEKIEQGGFTPTYPSPLEHEDCLFNVMKEYKEALKGTGDLEFGQRLYQAVPPSKDGLERDPIAAIEYLFRTHKGELRLAFGNWRKAKGGPPDSGPLRHAALSRLTVEELDTLDTATSCPPGTDMPGQRLNAILALPSDGQTDWHWRRDVHTHSLVTIAHYAGARHTYTHTLH